MIGTFGDIQYVLMVGVAGSVPHYTDFYKHVRLGDVVCSVPNQNGNMFIFCDKVQDNSIGMHRLRIIYGHICHSEKS